MLTRSLEIVKMKDWALLAGLLLFRGLMEFVPPFYRTFSLDDISIQHPIAQHERVSTPMCIVGKNSTVL